MGGTQSASWVLFCLICAQAAHRALSTTPSVDHTPFGFQSGNEDDAESSSYAASMVYNENNRELTITGGTYGTYFKPGMKDTNDGNGDADSDCFVAILHLPRSEDTTTVAGDTRLSWIRRRQFGSPKVLEYCSDLEVGPSGEMHVIGHSGQGGVLSSLLPYGNFQRQVYGTIMSLDDGVELQGGHLLHSSEIQYPVSIASDPIFQNHFVATIFTESDPVNLAAQDTSTSERIYRGGPDLTTTGYRPPLYGINFSVRLQRFVNRLDGSGSTELVETLQSTWTREYATSTMEDVQVSSLLYVSDTTLLMSGYTKGSGGAFGYPQTPYASSLDGFVTKIDPTSGDIIATKRIESDNPDSNERVLGLCRQPLSDSPEIFAVGMMNGFSGNDNSMNENHAFLMKMDSESMEILWTRQLKAIYLDGAQPTTQNGPQVHGMACVVTQDGEHVYMAGTVKDGAALYINERSYFRNAGADDLFIAQYRSFDGGLEYARQIGTSEDDSLAQGNSLATDAAGNLIVLGNTRGSFYRQKVNKGIADMFTMSIGRESGDYHPLVEFTQAQTWSTDQTHVSPDENGSDQSGIGDIYATLSSPNNSGGEAKQSKAVVAIIILLIAAFIMMILAALLSLVRRKQDLNDSLEGIVRETASTLQTERTGNNHLNFRDPKGLLGSLISSGSNNSQCSQISSIAADEPAHTIPLPTKSSSDDNRLTSDHKSTPRLGKAEDDNFDELFELLSEASERLSLDTDSSFKTAKQTLGSMSTTKPRTDESLDEVWGKDII